MAVTTDKPAPYAPPSAIIEVIDRYRNRGLPSPVTTEVLGRAGVSDSLIPRTLQALQSLELIDDDGKPTKTLEGIRLASEAEFKSRLEEWLARVYADVLSFVDPSKDDEVAVRDAFRGYQPVGQQSRMVTLFLGLFSAAGIAPERKSVVRPKKKLRLARPTSIRQPPPRDTSTSTSTAEPAPEGLPPAIAGLLSSLPKTGSGWSQAKRDKFVETFGVVLDFCFPIESKHTYPLQRGPDEEEEAEI